MKEKHLLIIALAVVLAVVLALVGTSATTRAQGPAKTLTLVYTNNLNGEIDPCPT